MNSACIFKYIIVCKNDLLVTNQFYIDNLLVLVTVYAIRAKSIWKFKQSNKESKQVFYAQNQILVIPCCKIKDAIFKRNKSAYPLK